MKKNICWMMLLSVLLAGCVSGMNFFKAMGRARKPSAQHVLIQKIDCVVSIPIGFKVTLSPIPEDDDPDGLIWRMEMPGTPSGITTTVELMYDPRNEKRYSLENYMNSEVIPELLKDGEDIALEKTSFLIAGIPAQMVKIADGYEGPKGPYTVNVRVVAMLKDEKIFKWVFTSNKIDALQMKPVFDQFLKSIHFQ